ncbi:unnamed protein product [Effrenium voratum]|uniref:Uncharacterized protein n=1 Tax=Effrenium voratum TaxID=2562239 RepID=A0AA36NDD9_9DINO|nr:unnamed protein product [Effrenium voratum]
MQSLFFGKHSIVAALEHSHLLKNRFEHHVKTTTSVVQSSVRSLSLAKQRFDSTQTPLGRFVLFFEPFLATVIEISRERRGEDINGDRAAFLAYINEEVLVQVAMIADAGDEGGQLCRAFDTELPASEELSSTVSIFLQKISCLFNEFEPVCLETGYTKLMLLLLEKRQFIIPTLDGKSVRTIGGPGSITVEMLSSCLRRMRTWAVLANEVIKHELPDWDLVSSFAIFDCKRADGLTTASSTRDTHIRRLAAFFNLDESLLRSQYFDLSPIAKVRCKNLDCSSQVAWQSVIAEVMSSQRRRDRHPCDVLQCVLARWCGWSPSTSAVEQSFGHGTHFATARQGCASEASENNDFTLLLDHHSQDEQILIRLSQQIWHQQFGLPRHHDRRRLDLGVKRQLQSNTVSEASWLRSRRSAVAAAVAKRQRVVATAGTTVTDDDDSVLDHPSHLKEKVVALRDGHLLPEEADDELESFLQLLADKKSELLRRPAITAKERKKDLIYSGFQQPGFIQGTGEVLKTCVSPGVPHGPARALGKLALQHDPCEARVIVAHDMHSLPEKFHWCAVLRGSFIVDTAMLSGQKGLCVKMKGIAHLKRFVWASMEFKQGNSEFYAIMCRLVDDCMGKRPMWQWLDTVDEFLTGKGVGYIALVTHEQQKLEASFQEHWKRFTRCCVFSWPLSLLCFDFQSKLCQCPILLSLHVLPNLC